ncbi:hypothetical protein [Microbispora amethystogenes]|uniref:Uncharacterized protein n=1 Tax=Microbispora amethystogenes TaxID=1427754 RepID=A0ABQ4FDD3_9ACTN|nr:hypothetical protein [Microbispora amethystogenes]GIH32822.1 hypothetical protein Mam01_29860 [Microbispora amethystogenes]
MRASWATTALLLSLTFTLAACTREQKPPKSVDDEVHRRDQALVAVVQCLVDHDRIPRSDLSGQPWLVQDKVRGSAELVEWLSVHRETVYEGKTLHAWEDEATAAWPGWKCPF